MGFDFLDLGFPKSGTDWKSINGKPYITVSSKGRSNGLSTKINDGADFGPDTTLNATSPNQTGAPYTQTSGIQEALDYAGTQSGQYNSRMPVYLKEGTGINNVFFVSSPININYDNSKIIGNGFIQSTDNSINAFNIGNATTGISHFTIENVGFYNFSNVFNVVNTVSSSFPWNFENLTFVGISNAVFIDTLAPLTPNVNFVNCNGGANYVAYLTVGGDQINFINSTLGGDIYVNLPSGYSTIFISLINSFINPGNVTLIGSGVSGGNQNNGFLMLYNSGVTENVTLTNSIITAYTSGIEGNLVFNAGSYAFMHDCGYGNSGTGTRYIIHENAGASGFALIDGGYALNLSTGTIETDDGTSVPVIVKNVVSQTNPANIHLTSVNVNNSTPAVPTSGTAQENTNLYAVNVYLYGGTVTEIQITKNGTAYTVFSNSTGLALSGQVYKLNPTDSITITYTSAPTWEWLSD